MTLRNFLATFEAEIVILPEATEIEMKNGVASENKNMYLKINIFILTVFINQTSTLPFRPVLPLYRNQSTDLQSKSMRWFLYNGKTSFFLMLNTTFHEESLLPFPWVSSLTIYFTQKHNTKNANWKFTKQ